jgi:uncharacterized protein (TIGR02466 family)
MFQILPLFPTPVYVAEVGNLSQEEYQIINSLETSMNVSGNSYSLDTKVLDSLPDLSERIKPHLQNYIDNILCPSTKVGLRFTQSWVNRNATNQAHHKHSHDNSIVSGVYYICPEIPPSIKFYRKKDSDISFEIGSHNPFNSKEYKVNIRKGMLVLFPSQLEHSVDINSGVEERISLAFNTFFTGIIGDENGLTKLELQ